MVVVNNMYIKNEEIWYEMTGTSWSSYIRFRYDIIKIEFRNLILIILNFDTVIRVRERCNYWKRERRKERKKLTCMFEVADQRNGVNRRGTEVHWVEKDRPKIEKLTGIVEGGPISTSHCFRRLRDVKPTTKWSNYSYRKRSKAKSDLGSFVRHRHVINLDCFWYSSYFSIRLLIRKNGLTEDKWSYIVQVKIVSLSIPIPMTAWLSPVPHVMLKTNVSFKGEKVRTTKIRMSKIKKNIKKASKHQNIKSLD